MDLARCAIVALGANLGQPREQVATAQRRLQELSPHPLRLSSLWKSTPVDCPPGSPPFINAIAIFHPHPAETPESLLAKLHDLERQFGRRPKTIPNEPRPLDLDLIAFGRETRGTPELTLPHPRAAQRKFVLAPLAELAPDLILPGQQQSVTELLGRCSPADPVVRIEF